MLITLYRWLVKRHRDDQALKILTKICNKDKSRAQSQLEEIQSTVSSASKEPLIQTLKYISQWKILQRYCMFAYISCAVYQYLVVLGCYLVSLYSFLDVLLA